MSRRVFQFPLKPRAQTFAIQLAGTVYNLTWRWNSMSSCWMLNVADADRVPLISNIAVVTGRDLLEPYRYIGIQGSLVAQTDNDPDVVPTFTDLGKTGRVYFLPTE